MLERHVSSPGQSRRPLKPERRFRPQRRKIGVLTPKEECQREAYQGSPVVTSAEVSLPT